jgi:hypothetical protein
MRGLLREYTPVSLRLMETGSFVCSQYATRRTHPSRSEGHLNLPPTGLT